MVTYRVIEPRTPAVWRTKAGNSNRSGREEGTSGDEETKEERVGPSSRASREAAASSCTSDGSQPPLGTRQGKEQTNIVSNSSA